MAYGVGEGSRWGAVGAACHLSGMSHPPLGSTGWEEGSDRWATTNRSWGNCNPWTVIAAVTHESFGNSCKRFTASARAEGGPPRVRERYALMATSQDVLLCGYMMESCYGESSDTLLARFTSTALCRRSMRTTLVCPLKAAYPRGLQPSCAPMERQTNTLSNVMLQRGATRGAN